MSLLGFFGKFGENFGETSKIPFLSLWLVFWCVLVVLSLMEKLMEVMEVEIIDTEEELKVKGMAKVGAMIGETAVMIAKEEVFNLQEMKV